MRRSRANTPSIDILLSPLLAVGVAACGSGGGSGSGSDFTFDTSEYRADYGKPQIKAATAYEAGGRGDVAVAVVDGLIDANHREFAGRVGGCYDTTDTPGEREGCTGDNRLVDDHGTHVSGTIGAARDGVEMHGVAFRAELYSVDIFGTEDSQSVKGSATSGDNQAAGIHWALGQGVAVMSHSYGFGGTHKDVSDELIEAIYGTSDDPEAILEAYRKAADRGVPMVWAAGNASGDEPSLNAALPIYYPELEDVWLAATASTPDRELAAYANACGEARDWCLMAPGGIADERIRSTVPDNQYEGKFGTSMAAAQLTGAVAVLIDLYGPGTESNMAPVEIVDLVLATADDAIDDYDPAVHGQGLLDMAAALMPDASTASIPTGSDPQAGGGSLIATRMIAGPAFGDALENIDGDPTLVAFDHLNRAIRVRVGAVTGSFQRRMDTAETMARFAADNPSQTARVPGPGFLLTSQSIANARSSSDARDTIRMRMEMAFSEDTSAAVSLNFGPARAIAYAGRATGLSESDVLEPDALGVPYLAFAERGMAAGGTTRVGGYGQFTWQAFSGEPAARARFAPEIQADGFAGEWTTGPIMGVSYGVRGGAIMEDNSVLGAYGSGAFAAEGAITTFAGVTAEASLAQTISLHAGYDVGLTSADGAGGGIIQSIKDVRSDSFRVAVAGRAFTENDRFAVIASQPLRVRSGTAEMRLPQRRDDNGNVVHTSSRLDLSPSGRELTLQTSYGRPLAGGDVAVASLLRLEPGHDSDAKPEALTMIRYRRPF